MGLDQYAFARKGEPIEATEDYTYQDFDGNTHTEQRTSVSYEEEHEVAYWRKHPNLQGWMKTFGVRRVERVSSTALMLN